MRKNFCLLLVNILFTTSIFAQTDSTFYYLNKSTLTNNVLCNFSDSVYWGMFDGIKDKTLKNKYALDILTNLNYYTFGSNEKPTTESVKLKAATQIRGQNKIPIFIVLYEYTRIKANALTNNLLRLENGKYRDVLPRSQTPYENKILVISAPLKEKIYSGSQTFYISRDFFVSNLPNPVTIQIDFNDGIGYRSVSFGQSVTVNYTNNNVKNIKTKITYNGNVLTAKAASTPEYCQGNFRPVDEFMITTATIPFFNPSPYNIVAGDGQWYDPNATGKSYARVYIAYGAGHPKGNLVKPLVFIEGIDFGYDSDFKYANNNVIRNGDVGWCEFWGQSYDPADPTNYLKGNPEFKNSPQFLNTMIAKGYDIMFVDFIDGADFIQRNAMIVVELLNTIKSRQASGGYASQPAVLIGASMGGQVGKYALSYMEKNGIKHCVRNYMSFDSPQNGANIPISLQQWINFFAFNGRNGGDDNAKLQLRKKMNRPATRQLLVRHYDDGNAYTYQDRIDFQNNMRAIGYPQKLRKVAIACGSKFGATQQYLSSGQQIIDTEWSPWTCANVNFIKGDCYTTGSNLSFAGRAFKNGALSCFLAAGVGTIAACALCASPNWLFDHSTINQPTSVPLWDNAPGGNRNTAEYIAQTYNEAVADYGGIIGGSATANPLGKPAIPRESFISTISALDVNTSNLTTDISNLIPNSEIPFPNLYPFDAYYASPINQPHVQLEDINLGVNSNINWAMNEILNSEPTQPLLLNSTSLNSGVYNLCRLQNRLIRKCTIGSGGKFYVNANLPADFGSATVPYPTTGTNPPVAGSLLEAQTCDCDNVTVEIQNGGQFILGQNSPNNKAKVFFHSGSTLLIRNGGKLIINDNSLLVIEVGAKIIYESGAQIQLLGNNAVLEIQGQLQIANNAVFTFLPATPTPTAPSGFLRFSMTGSSSDNIVAGTGSSMTFNGQNSDDKVLEIIQESMYAGSLTATPLVLFKITNGLVAMGSNARMNVGCPVTFSNVRVTSTSGARNSHRGLTVYGQSGVAITNSTFENGAYGLYAWLTYGGVPLTLTNCTFKNCNYGLFTHDKGVTLNTCTFIKNTSPTGNPGYGWYAEAMSLPCTMNNCIVGGSTANGNTEGIRYKASGVALQINTSDISYNYYGLTSEGASATIQCGGITENIGGIYLLNNGSVRMDNTISQWGSQVNASNNNITIQAEKAGMFYLDGGSNDLTPKIASNAAIYGTIAGCGTLPSAPNPPYYVRGNKWNNLCTFTSNDYSLTKLINTTNTPCAAPNTYPLLLDNGPLRAIYQCGMPPNPLGCVPCPTCPPDEIAQSCPTCSSISTQDFSNVKLNKAVRTGIDKMNSSDADKYKTAVNLFTQIVSAPIASPTAEERYLLDLSHYKMLEALGSAVREKQIACGKNLPLLAKEIKTIEKIHNDIISKYKGDQDYYPMLYATMEKAQTYRVAERRDLAIAVLNSISTWVQPEDIPYVQERKCMIEIEQQVLSGQMAKEDAASAMEKCSASNTRMASPPSVNTTDSTDAKKQVLPDNTTTIQISPNPNTGTFNVDVSGLSITEINRGEFELYDLTGKKQFSYAFQEGQNKFTVSEQSLSNGIYFYRLISNGKMIYQGKLVVIKE